MKVKLTLPTAQLPKRSNPTDAGMDLFSPFYVSIPPNSHAEINFGVCVEIPVNNAGFIYARSGLGSNHGIRPRNCVGVIDSKYRNELKCVIENDSNETYNIQVGDRIAQLIICPIILDEPELVDELDMEDDRNGGFGSTGK